MNVTVVVVLFNDLRVKNTLDSLLHQTRKPDQILLADGGSPDDFKRTIQDFIKPYAFIRLSHMPGRCIDTRRRVIDTLIFNKVWIEHNYKTNILMFIDSDEIAEESWLERMTAPIEKGTADFTAGTTIQNPTPKSKPEKILNIIQEQNNCLLKEDITYMPMGNSAWHTNIFRKIGNFDDTNVSTATDSDTVAGSYHISDDYDINLRAIQAGFKGKYISDAEVFHNQVHINTFFKLIKYFYGQFVRAAMAYLKHKEDVSKFTSGSRQTNIVHPFQLFLLILKPIALMHGWKEWSMIKK